MKNEKLKYEERLLLYRLLRHGTYSFRQIAKELDRHHSTIIREYKRNLEAYNNQDDYYIRARKAHELAKRRRQEASLCKMRLKNEVIRHYVELHISQAEWSPETVAGKLKRLGYFISAEAIYQYINYEKPELKKHLLVAGKSRRRRRVGKSNKRIPRASAPKKSIDVLPIESLERKEIGHFELDAMHGCKGGSVLQVKVDRKARKMFLDKSKTLCSKNYAELLISRLSNSIPKGVLKTILNDNGTEHAEHLLVEEKLKALVYFCHPYCASERGTVENRNKALRRFFQKGQSLDDIPDDFIEWVEDYFNNTPMKVLGFLTPNQVWEAELKKAA